MEQRFTIPRQRSLSNRARFFASTENTPFGSHSRPTYNKRAMQVLPAAWLFEVASFSGGGRLEHGQNARVIQVAGRDAFEMRTDAAQFGSHEAVHKMQTPVEPGKHFVLDLVVNRQGDLRAVRPNLSEINDAHQGNIAAHRLECILV